MIIIPARFPRAHDLKTWPAWIGQRVERRHLLPIGVGIVLSILIASLLFLLTRPAALPVGSRLPAIMRTGPDSASPVRLVAGKTTVVVYYRAGCASCESQIGMMAREISQLSSVQTLLMTGDEAEAMRTFSGKWPALSESHAVRWVSVDGSSARRALGIVATPTILVFDPGGRLTRKIVGEASVRRILDGQL